MTDQLIGQQAFRTAISTIERMPASMTLYRVYSSVLRALGGQYWAETYYGAKILCDPNDMIQHYILHFGVWEPNVSAVIDQILEPGDVCVDIGANIGYDALLASSKVGPHGKVIAIEASPSIYAKLAANVAKNNAQNVRLVSKAVSDEPGQIPIYQGPGSNIGRTTIVEERGFTLEGTVEALPLDMILTPEEMQQVKFIKIDIEGAEAPVLQRFLDKLELYRADVSVLVEISPSDIWRDLFDKFIAAGFSAYQITNDYSREYYLHDRRKVDQLSKATVCPDEQADVLFTKGSPPKLGCRW